MISNGLVFSVNNVIVTLQKLEQQEVESAYVNAKDIELMFEIKQVRFVCLRFSSVV